MQRTSNDNLICHLSSKYGFEVRILSTRLSNIYLALELWISTELVPENNFYKAKMKIFKEIVFHRLVNLFTKTQIFVSHFCETRRLSSKARDLRGVSL